MSDKYTFKSGPKDVEFPPVASGTVIEIGDLLKLSSGKMVVQVTTTDNLDSGYVAAAAHGAADPSGTIAVYPPDGQAVHEFSLDAATDITYGDRLQFNTKSKLKKSTTDGIFMAVESKLQATTILCRPLISHKAGNTDRVADAS